MIGRLFPAQIDNRLPGHRAALWLLGVYIALKLVMSINSILNTAAVASGADGIPLASFGPDAARMVLLLFALTALGQLALALLGILALVRYKAMVPLVLALLLAEHLARRLIVSSYATGNAPGSPIGFYINLGLGTLLGLALILSLVARPGDSRRASVS